MSNDVQAATAVIYNIVELSTGNRLETRTRLFKAFYFAHLYYAKATGRPLTHWPIVRMPNGPGIHDADFLIHLLTESGHIEQERVSVGPYPSDRFRTGHATPLELDDEQRKAIADAVEFVTDKTAAQLSDLTHENSRSWQSSRNGDAMDIYLDLLNDDEYEERVRWKQELKESSVIDQLRRDSRDSLQRITAGEQGIPLDTLWNEGNAVQD